MPEPEIVWLVEPPRSSDGVEGTLTLVQSPASLVFEATRGKGSLEIPFARLDRVRRIRGAPILEVHHRAHGIAQEAFFYFTPPPPGPGGEGHTSFFQGLARRREQRRALTWLGMRNAPLKDVVRAWEAEIEALKGFGKP